MTIAELNNIIVWSLHVCSILAHYMDHYKQQAKSVPKHIPSKHSKEMATKSVVVSNVYMYIYNNYSRSHAFS